MNIAERLKYLRENSELTQQELGDKLGVTRATIASYETGKSSISVNILIEYAKFFNVTTDWITCMTDNINVKITESGALTVKHDKKINLSESDMKNLEKALKIVLNKSKSE